MSLNHKVTGRPRATILASHFDPMAKDFDRWIFRDAILLSQLLLLLAIDTSNTHGIIGICWFEFVNHAVKLFFIKTSLHSLIDLDQDRLELLGETTPLSVEINDK